MKPTEPKLNIKGYLTEWMAHILFAPIGAVVLTCEGIRDWFKYRPKKRNFYVKGATATREIPHGK